MTLHKYLIGLTRMGYEFRFYKEDGLLVIEVINGQRLVKSRVVPYEDNPDSESEKKVVYVIKRMVDELERAISWNLPEVRE